jgi:hypothetical protein
MKTLIPSSFLVLLGLILISATASGPIFPEEALEFLEGNTWGGKMTHIDPMSKTKTQDSVEIIVTRQSPSSNTWTLSYHFPGKSGLDKQEVYEWKKKGKMVSEQHVVDYTETKAGQHMIITLEKLEQTELRHTYMISPYHFVHKIATIGRLNDHFVPTTEIDVFRKNAK